MRQAEHTEIPAVESELIAAALRYVAFADWFEALPVARIERRRELQTMSAFNKVEADLRKAGMRVLRRDGRRRRVLARTLEELLP